MGLAAVAGLAVWLDADPVLSLDGTPSPNAAALPAAALAAPDPTIAAPKAALAPANVPNVALSPSDAFRRATEALKSGERKNALTSLQYAADHGHGVALWQLGRMYAEGDGVVRDDRRAFEYFRKFADSHADDHPSTPRSRFVANAFVALGHYYLDGIPNSPIKADPGRAQEMFSYAASYFGDPDAQYYLARLYLDGKGTPRDARQAARWLSLSANKGQHQAQALLGRMLFRGETVPRQVARGLMWLTLARDSAGGDETWISDLYESAFKQATDDERALALVYLERWIKGRRD
jgi:exopolysaccharide production negative regulator